MGHAKKRPPIKKPTQEYVEAQKNKGGRPREWTEELIEVERQELDKWIHNPENYYLTNFLIERDLDNEGIARFCRYSERFRDTFEKAKRVQESRLVNLAVSKKGDGGFIKFVLQNRAGWKERNEISGDQANPLTVLMEQISNKPYLQIESDE